MRRVLAILALCIHAAACAEPTWQDPSPHTRKVIEVEQGVSLEVLDWGGPGRAIVLLSGLGTTAHIFDTFAPKLARKFHVYGITRRGFGASSAPTSGYTPDRLGDDVLAVLKSLQLDRPVLAGHSIAGEELSSIGSRHPERVAGMIYLDAVMPYSFDDGKSGVSGADFTALQEKLKFPNSAPTSTAVPTPEAIQQNWLRVTGVLIPASEFHQWNLYSDGAAQAILQSPQRYSNLPVPILALCADPQNLGPLTEASRDPEVVTARTQMRALRRRVIAAFERGVPSAHMVRMPANHMLFISNEQQVLVEIESFLQTLPRN